MRYGSLTNQLQDRRSDVKVTVGMGATMLGWTDRYPFTVVRVISPTKIVVQADRAERLLSPGQPVMSEGQEYRYERDPEGKLINVSLRKDGRWRAAGRHGETFLIGTREMYHDYSF